MSWGIFMTGIMAGIATVYGITKYLDFSTIEEPANEEVEIPQQKTESCTMTVEEMDAWYNSVMEIFK